MKARRLLPLLALGLALSALVPVVAAADGPSAPSLSPKAILTEGFESASTNYTVRGSDIDPLRPPTAWWGRKSEAGSYRTGAYGLWCAGTKGTWSSYPVDSAGYAIFSAKTADYFASYADFWYRMPSLGAADANSFRVDWSTDPSGDRNRYVQGFAKTSSWTHRVIDLSPDVGSSSSSKNGNLSRSNGIVRLRWNDSAEGGAQSPMTGAGPCVDDFAITGWKYGPVRDLAWTVSPASVTLTWKRPYRTTATTALEDRTIGYRVFRAVRGTSSWTQVTPSLLQNAGAALTYTDNSVSAGVLYTYAVQAFDTAGGYGMPKLLGQAPATPVRVKATLTTPNPSTS